MTNLILQLSDASGVPRYRQIVDQVAALVRSGQLSPGVQLPSVRELAGQLLVSLITTRRAYADLESDGLIIRRQGQGTFVADDVTGASRRRAEDEARALLDDAVTRAGQLGLRGRALRDHIEDLLARQQQEGDDA
jgi:GntR family transcriptional regulator